MLPTTKLGLTLYLMSLVGGLIEPVSLLGRPIIVKAAVYTAGIVAGLSLVAATVPSEKFWNFSSISLVVVVAWSVGK